MIDLVAIVPFYISIILSGEEMLLYLLESDYLARLWELDPEHPSGTILSVLVSVQIQNVRPQARGSGGGGHHGLLCRHDDQDGDDRSHVGGQWRPWCYDEVRMGRQI